MVHETLFVGLMDCWTEVVDGCYRCLMAEAVLTHAFEGQ